ncbi:hypothetical protein CLV25_1122 [Acetobacteroides hydrogenigenes]|uniref:Uncharacterized protein n=1 Tax=Acetobacteroides hydrogenigenes TaxID=979970 RepID=A0A4R2EA19_9BACT|nr:hypothetical protein CLV25_1122 [Acetobacteroides hydrogenigenes]
MALTDEAIVKTAEHRKSQSPSINLTMLGGLPYSLAVSNRTAGRIAPYSLLQWQQQHSFPFAFSKASLPSVNEK